MTPMTLTTLGLTDDQLKLMETIYRLVGRRDAGWKFDPSIIPGYIAVPLIGEYLIWLAESEQLTEDALTACDALLVTLEPAYKEAA